MSTKVNPIPDGYPVVCPYLVIRGAARALDFYREALGAKERMRFAMPDGKIGHAEIELSGSVVMLADEFPEMGCKSPEALGGSPMSLHVYVTDADAAVARAVKHGAKVLRPVKDQFYGDRSGAIEDPFGYTWNIATRIENLTLDEMRQRAAQAHGA